MFDFLSRLIGLFRREASEGLAMSAGAASAAPSGLRPMTTAPTIEWVSFEKAAVEIIAARTTAPAAPRPAVPAASAGLIAARLQSVARLNPPSALARKKSLRSPAHKPRPVQIHSAPKRRADAKSGLVLERMQKMAPLPSAEIIDLDAERRARRIQAVQAELAAIFQ